VAAVDSAVIAIDSAVIAIDSAPGCDRFGFGPARR
jgi:hypothetical protein